MKQILSAALAVAVGLGAIAATAGAASAYVVCNGAGDCWHTDHRYRYGPEVRAEVHPDHWYFHRDWDHDNEHHWRSYHEGRGYYNNGVWNPF